MQDTLHALYGLYEPYTDGVAATQLSVCSTRLAYPHDVDQGAQLPVLTPTVGHTGAVVGATVVVTTTRVATSV